MTAPLSPIGYFCWSLDADAQSLKDHIDAHGWGEFLPEDAVKLAATRATIGALLDMYERFREAA